MKIYLVGGAVRDSLLGLSIKDRDWLVVHSTPEIMLKKGYKQVGKDFPVFLHPKTNEEYSLARIEHKCNYGYHGFNTYYSPNITLEEDLSRRDLTINAIAKDQYGKYIDPYNGKRDIKLRILRHVSSSFIEDPLRILRVARFSASLAHLGFKIDSNTMSLMKNIVHSQELIYLTKERIWKEIEKALMTKNPHVFFMNLKYCNALSFIFPEFNHLYKKFFLFHNKKVNVAEYTLLSLEKISRKTLDIDVRFAVLFKYFGNYFLLHNNSNNKKNNLLVINLFKCLKIPNRFKFLSLIIFKFYSFFSKLHLRSSKDIVFFLNSIRAWKDITVIKKIICFIDVENYKYSKKYGYFYRPDIFLKNIISITENITIKSIKSNNFYGIQIKNELDRLRILAIEKWRSSL
ncbi:Multifunctional CCA protein [Buchnera aphidicola (Neophyllaphis podocarpi)]|uniref:hypothetical protein n=1 Tax=Buchnera aphidicola TaxID=9 RepID=UPI003463F71A